MEHQPKIVKQPSVTVGRFVHYYDANMRIRTAIVTALGRAGDVQPSVVLTIFPPGADPLCSPDEVSFSEEPKALHWTWPPRA
jgi:hypothetical protein